MFKIIDDDLNRRIDYSEFKKGIHDYGLFLEHEQLQELFARFDRDSNGVVDFDEFLISLRVSIVI